MYAPIAFHFQARQKHSGVRVSVWGPSGDDLDVLFDGIELFEEMDEEDWMAFGNAAAAMAGASSAQFDVFQAENEEDIWCVSIAHAILSAC
jgi:diaminopimelate decarboxylase